MSKGLSASRSISPDQPPKKRKRSHVDAEELEVDVNAPEPPSKKSLRKAKKLKTTESIAHVKERSTSRICEAGDDTQLLPSKAPGKSSNGPSNGEVVDAASGSDDDRAQKGQSTKRSEFGVWIGNLPWSATKQSLRNFLTSETGISDTAITRIHLPTANEATPTASRGSSNSKNKGFAFVDFSTKQALTAALELSETLLTGRRVLIKDSKSFEGRPDKAKEDAKPDIHSKNPPSKRVFVGNLGFDTTKEVIQEHFSRCGDILDIHLATFEDSGKCKGYGWVEFESIEAGQAAVRGWASIEQDQNDDKVEVENNGSGEAQDVKLKKKLRPRKWWVNKLQGRPLRMEFAEDKAIRYKKRFGKNATVGRDAPQESKPNTHVDDAHVTIPPAADLLLNAGKANATQRPHRKKVDARTIKPGAALAAAPRLQGSIVTSQGKKTILA